MCELILKMVIKIIFKKKSITLFLLTCVCFANSFCAISRDKDTIKIEIAKYDSLNIKGAISLFDDSLVQVITHLSKKINEKNQETNIDRTYDYSDLELILILNTLNSNLLNSEERNIGNRFINEFIVFGKILDESVVKINIENYLKKHPKSLFIQRLKLYFINNSSNSKTLINSLTEILKIDSTVTGANLLMGEIFYEKNNFSECVKYFTKVLTQYPTSAFVYDYRALAYSKLGQFEKSYSDFDSALILYPKYDVVYNNRANNKYHQGKFEEAIKDYKKSIEINPKLNWSYDNLGLVFTKLNKNDSALYYYKKVADINPDKSSI